MTSTYIYAGIVTVITNCINTATTTTICACAGACVQAEGITIGQAKQTLKPLCLNSQSMQVLTHNLNKMSTLTMVYLLYYICYYLLNIIKVFSALLFRQTKLRDALDIDYSHRLAAPHCYR